MKMGAILDPNNDLEEAIVGIQEDKTIRNFRNEIVEDYSTSEAEYQNDLFPLNKVFNSAEWRRAYNKYWHHQDEKIELFDKFEGEIIERR